MASKTFYSNKYDNRQLRLELTQHQDILNNRSRIHWRFVSEGNTSSATLYQVYATDIRINGQQVYYKGLTYWYGTGTPERPVRVFPAAEGSVSGDVWVNHNADGSLSIPIYFRTGVYASAYHKDYGGTFTLDKIPRKAELTSAPNFTDEQNPTISYSNPAGNAATTLQVQLTFDGDNDAGEFAYRDISKTGSSYTFNFTDEERKRLRNACLGTNNMNVTFRIKTVIGNNTWTSAATKTFSIVNANPVLSNLNAVDNIYTGLTGDNNVLIRYISRPTVSGTVTLQKEAVLKSFKASNAGISRDIRSGGSSTWAYEVESGSFTFTAVDWRGNVTTETITKDLIPYIKLSCNIGANISIDGTGTVTLKGNYWRGNFGAQENTLQLTVDYKEQNADSWTSYILDESNITYDYNTYTATLTLPELDYQKAYMFKARAQDRVSNLGYTKEIITKSMPVYDWGADDFRIHGDLIVEGTITGSNATAAVTLGDELVVPAADFIVEQGNNGSYAYKKWNSGLLEAWRSAKSTVSVTSDNTSGSSYYTDQVSLTTNGAASQFVSLETVLVSVNKNGAVGFWQPVVARTAVSSGAASADVFFTNTVKDATAAIIPQIYFIGRWK